MEDQARGYHSLIQILSGATEVTSHSERGQADGDKEEEEDNDCNLLSAQKYKGRDLYFSLIKLYRS